MQLREILKSINQKPIKEILDSRRPPKEVSNYIRQKLGKKRLMVLSRSIYQKTGFKELSKDQNFQNLLKKYRGSIKNNQFDTPDGFEVNFD